MIAARLQSEIRSGSLIDESQGEFIEGRSYAGQVLTLETIVKLDDSKTCQRTVYS